MSTMTLTEFLLARIADDAADAEGAAPGGLEWGEVGAISEVLIMGRDRLLAECDAKRRIVELAETAESMIEGEWSAASSENEGWLILANLALPYADHPDYLEEWKP